MKKRQQYNSKHRLELRSNDVNAKDANVEEHFSNFLFSQPP